MSFDELGRYVLTRQQDVIAFQTYVDLSKAEGRMISIDLQDSHWEENLTNQIHQRSFIEGETDQP